MKNTGKAWEARILRECQQLIDERLGYVFKVPVDHSILKSTGPSRFEVQYKESPFDFVGHVRGYPVAFEAKHGSGPLPLLGKGKKGAGLKHHQRNNLAMVTATGGVAFVYYWDDDTEAAYLFMVDHKGDLGQGKRKSVPVSEGWILLPDETFFERLFRAEQRETKYLTQEQQDRLDDIRRGMKQLGDAVNETKAKMDAMKMRYGGGDDSYWDFTGEEDAE